MSTSKTMRWVTFGLEAFLGIPIIGASVILGFYWMPLLIMLVLHIVTLNICIRERADRSGSILGIVTSAIGWIPFVGMIMHWITAIVLLTSAMKKDQNQDRYIAPPPPPRSF
jgi:hypothetical protein